MHEASLVSGLIAQIKRIAGTENAKRVTSVEVWLGALCHMAEEHFADHFTLAARGTPAEGARLVIRVSSDLGHRNAQDIVLNNVEVET